MRYLHTMLRVTDLDRSLHFYTEVLGLKLHSRKEYPGGKFTLAFLGGELGTEPFLELTHNWDTNSYDFGNAYGHVALGVTDIYKVCEEIKTRGGVVSREPGPMKHGDTVIAFVRDPDNYAIELIQRR